MICKTRNCGAQGLFGKTEGYCPRCYEELQGIQDYYDRKMKHREEVLPYLGWMFVLAIIGGLVAWALRVFG